MLFRIARAGANVGKKNASLLWGLYLLRLGLGSFLALWAIDKFVAPQETVESFLRLYHVSITPSVAMILGALQLVLSLLLILGMYKTLTYGLGLAVHAIASLAYYPQLLSPFGKNHFFLAAIPILIAFIALFILREFDTKLSLSKKKSLFT